MSQNGGIRGPGQIVTSTAPAKKANLSEAQQYSSLGNWPGLIFYQNYSTPGTYSFTSPIDGNISYMAIGGGGGGDNGNVGDGGGGGGGGGGCIYASNVAVSVGDILTIVVGAGGSGPATYNSDSNPGGNSSVTLTQTGKTNFVITAQGGYGGKTYPAGVSLGGMYDYTASYNNGTVAGGSNKVLGTYAGGGGGAGYNGGGGGGGAASAGGNGGGGIGSIGTNGAGTIGPTGGQGGAASTTASAPSSGGGAGGSGQHDITGGGGGGGYTYSSSVPTTAGGNGNGLTTSGSKGGNGGFPGGGGGGSWDTGTGVTSDGGNGFVRIVWGTNASGARLFPVNALDT
jgi:hypothetical protein